MKGIRKIAGLLLILAVCLGIGLAAAEGLTHDVLVLFTSDIHCGVDQGFTLVGLKAIKDTAEARGKHVLLVDDGDAVQGEAIGVMTQGMLPIELMNAVGYDAAVPGNHEFDYGMDRFFELAEAANFPYISCNFRKEGKLVFDPYIIKEFEGVKIAFVGASTPETLVSSTPRYFQDEKGNFIYDFTQGGDGSEFYAAVQKAVDDARAEGAQYVFLIAHLGNEASVKPYLYSDVIEHTNGINAVLDGHSHDTNKVVMKNKDGETVIRQACGTKMACIGWLQISAKDGSVDTGLYKWDNDLNVPALLGIENELNDLMLEKSAWVTETLSAEVGTSAVKLTIDDPEAKDSSGQPIRLIRMAETNLGDFVADAFLAASGADVAVANGGCIRTSIEAGKITAYDLLAVFPFGNKMMMAEVTGQQLLDALEWGASAVPEENGAFLHVAGLSYEIHTYIESTCTKNDDGMFTGVAGERRVKNVLVGGEPLDPDQIYKVASLSYVMVDHGDGHTAFDGGKIIWESEETDREILTNFIKNNLGGVIGAEYEAPYGQERIVAVQTAP